MNLPDMLVFLVGGGITLTAFITLVERVFSPTATKCAEAIRISLWKSFLIGLVNAVFFIFLAALMFNVARGQLNGLLAGLVNLIAVVILVALGILASIGLSGFSFWLEERIANSEHSLTTALKSSLLLVLACMAPFVGWFLLTPFVVSTSIGSAIQTVFRRKEKIVVP
jgi:hypothetical protein